ncbi:GTP-binding protein [Geomicrobium halophilum]|uniref:GTPase Obg n=1 Tax=Geomicrobium halophilum TaxID=549000 RepID=A0A841PT91_9BACL|nr:GTPase ObgE [Geomicrobium halophilum]MBB6449521.1 GTP-binding protein [Geomicrobium halophilum]
MFIDYVNIFVKSGDGGNGMVAYRREKFVPDGGPAGGDGGKGGDVIFRVDEGTRTLMDFRYQHHFRAKHGENGRPKGQHGKGADPLIVTVPPGTVIKDKKSGKVIADLVEHKEEKLLAKGGRGGRGNKRFATPANPAPEHAENGEPGVELEVTLELKLLADVGIIGFPSVGKSTFLSVATAAKPKIADYPFTTIDPNLGVVASEDGRSFVMADLPGIIEGAHEGVGLGHRFLRHIERTRILVHMLDVSGMSGRDPYEDYVTINRELEKYNEALKDRPQLIVANKIDMPGSEELIQKLETNIGERIERVSTHTKQGLDSLIRNVADRLDEAPEPEPITEDIDEDESRAVYRYEKEKEFEITRDDDGAFVLYGEPLERRVRMLDLSRRESAERFSRTLRKMGVDAALRERGAKDGDTIRLLGIEFEFME